MIISFRLANQLIINVRIFYSEVYHAIAIHTLRTLLTFINIISDSIFVYSCVSLSAFLV